MKIKKNKKIIYFLSLCLIIPFTIFAADIKGIEDPTGGILGDNISETIKNMIGGLLKLAIPFLVLAYVYVAFLFVKAQGAAEKLKEAKKAFVWLLVGTAIIVGADVIFSVIKDTLSQANIK